MNEEKLTQVLIDVHEEVLNRTLSLQCFGTDSYLGDNFSSPDYLHSAYDCWSLFKELDKDILDVMTSIKQKRNKEIRKQVRRMNNSFGKWSSDIRGKYESTR